MTLTEQTTRVQTLPVQALAAALAATDCTRSGDSGRPVLTGWQVRVTEQNPTQLVVMSCDSYAGTRATVQLFEECAPLDALVGCATWNGKPVKLSSQPWAIRATDPRQLVPITVSQTALHFTALDGNVSVLSVSDGEFPRFEDLLIERARVITPEAVKIDPAYLDTPTKSQAAVKRATGVKVTPNYCTITALDPLKAAVFEWSDASLGVFVEHLIMPRRA